MLKYISGAGALVVLLGVLFMVGGCGESNAKNIFSMGEYIVGKDIAITDIKDFYYTIDASTYPPQFQRYRFTNDSGKYSFYHEKREGNSWPLKEKDITLSGTITLQEKEWSLFVSCINKGKVTKRKEDANAGGRGPWLFLYWTKDENKYQVFEFASAEQKKSFEELCQTLKNTKK